MDDLTFDFNKSVSIGVGARVMLKRNYDTSIGLVNGSIGTITDIEWSNEKGKHKIPKAVLIKFDNKNIAQTSLDTKGDSVRIRPMTVTFKSYIYKILKLYLWLIMPFLKPLGKDLYSSCQIPLILSWGITIYKAQGMYYMNTITHT